jgi:hypothetical protein
MVPTVRLTSMFELPSSGSKTSRYLPRLQWAGRVDVLHFLGGHAAQVAGPLVFLEHHVVAHDVELLLHFALDIDRGRIGAGIAQRADQRALVDLVGNDLDRRGQRVEQAGEFARGARMLVFLLDGVTRQRLASLVHEPCSLELCACVRREWPGRITPIDQRTM